MTDRYLSAEDFVDLRRSWVEYVWAITTKVLIQSSGWVISRWLVWLEATTKIQISVLVMTAL